MHEEKIKNILILWKEWCIILKVAAAIKQNAANEIKNLVDIET
ncbi:hypothetical protein [Bacillus sp. AFS014408]|nr:hypothetical protein [Bacillus sp. AFS014408]